MESKFDYITLTLKSDTKTFEEAFNFLCETMLFGDLVNKMSFKGRAGFYDYCLTYENIMLLYTTAERFKGQGICIKISSQGLDYFNRYLTTCGLTLKDWLGRWRSLVFGDYVTKCTRFDYAMDDIVKVGEAPTINILTIFRCAQNGEICKKSRTLDLLSGADMSARMRIKHCDGQPIKGRTLYIGVRQSDKLVRFYDKLAEQRQQKKPVPADIGCWTRCELELHGDAAMGALNAFLDKSDEDFAEYMRGVVNNQCRFISRTNANVSRCPVKRWWTAFLNGCTKRFKLPHNEPVRSAWARADRGLDQYVRTIYTMFQELGLEGVYRYFESKVEDLKAEGKVVFNSELAENLREDVLDYEQMNGFKHYLYNSSYSENDFAERLQHQEEFFKHLFCRVRSKKYSELHLVFMDGQEVLLDGL